MHIVNEKSARKNFNPLKATKTRPISHDLKSILKRRRQSASVYSAHRQSASISRISVQCLPGYPGGSRRNSRPARFRLCLRRPSFFLCSARFRLKSGAPLSCPRCPTTRPRTTNAFVVAVVLPREREKRQVVVTRVRSSMVPYPRDSTVVRRQT